MDTDMGDRLGNKQGCQGNRGSAYQRTQGGEKENQGPKEQRIVHAPQDANLIRSEYSEVLY